MGNSYKSSESNSKGYEDIYLARQPVFNSNMELQAYELLYRDRKIATNAVFVDKLQATLKVLAGLPLCLDLTGEKNDVIVNFPSKAIIDQMQTAYPPQLTIVQLTDTEYPEEELIKGIKHLKQKGYRFSFDNFENDSSHDFLCKLADYITIDFLGHNKKEIEFFASECKKKNSKCKLIAKRIEEYDDYLFAKDLGFEFFQGYFFKQPKVHSGKKISTNSVSKLKILKLLQKEDVEFREISNVLATDVSVVHRLLVYINSPSLGLRKKVSSIEEALVIMGLDPLKKWLQIILLTELKPKEKPHELVLLSAQRGYFLELLAKAYGSESIKNQLFLLGLFSLIDSILDHPKEELLTQLSLAKEIEDALLGKESEFSPWLDLIDNCEKADWAEVDRVTDQFGFSTRGLYAIYEEAYNQAKSFF